MQKLYDLPETALIDMGDFVGGMLKYLRTPSGAARHHRGRRRQDDQARAGPARSAFAARLGRSRRARRARRAGGRHAPRSPRASSPPTPPPKPSRMPRPTASRSAMRSRAPVGHRRHVVAGKPVAGEPIAIEIVVFDRDGPAGRPRAVPGRSRRAPAEAAPIVRVVERAVAEILRGRARARPGSARCARSARPRAWRRCRQACRARSARRASSPAPPPRPDNRRRRTA